jgi:hypothetical protein
MTIEQADSTAAPQPGARAPWGGLGPVLVALGGVLLIAVVWFAAYRYLSHPGR